MGVLLSTDSLGRDIKNLTLDIIAQQTKPITEEQHFIKSKVIDILLELVLRDWPHKVSAMHFCALAMRR